MKSFLLLITGLVCVTPNVQSQERASSSTPSKVDFAKKIVLATPEVLPQSPVLNRPSTDAQDNGLKGSVKSVIEYMEEPRQPRESRSEAYYGKDGNLIKTVSYMEGYPDSVSVYGYLDGSRVEKLKRVEYMPGERPSKHLTIIGTTGEVASSRDPRYTVRYEYRYDAQRRLTEVVEYENDGNIFRRRLFSYGPSEREEKVLSGSGRLQWRAVYILDQQGNVREERWYDEASAQPDIEVYTREYDSNGNWTVERTYDPSKRQPKQQGKLLWVKYRMITYY